MSETVSQEMMTSISTNPQLLISTYFDAMINKIDLNAETALSNDSYSKDEKKKINQLRENYVSKAKEIESKNHEKLNERQENFKTLRNKLVECREQNNTDSSEISQLIKSIFSQFCIYISTECFCGKKFSSHSHQPLGFLVVIDFYCTPVQVERLKKYLVAVKFFKCLEDHDLKSEFSVLNYVRAFYFILEWVLPEILTLVRRSVRFTRGLYII
jgi:hypothetical protein